MTTNITVQTIHGGYDLQFTAVPTKFLEQACSRFHLTAIEGFLVAQILSFKWDHRDPYPSVKTLAIRLGVTTRTVQNLLKSVEAKGLLKRVPRYSRNFEARLTNAYDMSPLFDAVS